MTPPGTGTVARMTTCPDTAEPAGTPAVPPLLYDLPEAGRLTGLGRSTLYRQMDTGQLGYVKVGARRLIPRTALLAWLATLQGGER